MRKFPNRLLSRTIALAMSFVIVIGASGVERSVLAENDPSQNQTAASRENVNKQIENPVGDPAPASAAQVRYQFTAKDAMGREITDLPDDIMATLPAPEAKEIGDTVQPTAPTETRIDSKYKDREGHWSFRGWDKKSLKVTGNPDQDVFVGK